MNRLNNLPTLRVDVSQKISFKYKNKAYSGVMGDTVATALFAGGVRVFGRSLKYHRPRGLYSLDGECSNTMMNVDGAPNVRTEMTLLKEGMAVKPQNVMGTPEFDLQGILNYFDWAMPAGFYYRTFHKPARFWPTFAKYIRKAAGLGKISPDYRFKGMCDEIYPKAEVCVIGGGPAGMAAALAAAESGLRVVLLEARPNLGGDFDYRTAQTGDAAPLHQKAADLARAVEAADKIRVFPHARVVGSYNDSLITAIQTGKPGDHFDYRYIEVRAEAVVCATGCIERPLLFDNNERPGVMQAGCALRLARTYGILPGEAAVFATGHDFGLEAAADLADMGMKVKAVADCREDGQDPAAVERLAKLKIPFLRGWTAKKAGGCTKVRKVRLAPVSGIDHKDYACDTLVASAGFTPMLGPILLAQGKTAFDLHTGFFLPTDMPPKMHAAGRMLGYQDPASIEASGRAAGLAAAADCGGVGKEAADAAKEALAALPGPARGSKLVTGPVKGRKTFICFDEDATVKNVNQSMAMGFDVPELIKRFSAAGTGPGQGGIPGHNLPLYVARKNADPLVGYPATNVRAPLMSSSMAAFAGTNHVMAKRTPLHESQKQAGGQMEQVGVWRRVRYFTDDKRSRKEIENVRANVGLIDVSTLGKFRLFGPDALKALQRVYVSDMSKIGDGKIKYSAMCNDDGCLVDDGVVAKVGENDYYLTTSTARAGQNVEWFRYHTRFDGWEFHLVNLTDALGAINIAGPNARKVLEKITDADLSNEAFPYAGFQEITLNGGIVSRTMRLGFVGELSYELHVPSSLTQTVWEMLEEAGKEFGIANFGLEAQSTLRLEKGHVIVGSESEQRTTLHDLGMGFLAKDKPEAKTVGAVALAQTKKQENRLKLVGFVMEDASRAPKDGSPVVDSRIRGWVCTARYSFSLKQSVGLALVDAPLADLGTRIEIFEDDCNNQRLYAKVVKPHFYDPDGSRMKM